MQIGATINPMLKTRDELEELFAKCDAVLDENEKVVTKITTAIKSEGK